VFGVLASRATRFQTINVISAGCVCFSSSPPLTSGSRTSFDHVVWPFPSFPFSLLDFFLVLYGRKAIKYQRRRSFGLLRNYEWYNIELRIVLFMIDLYDFRIWIPFSWSFPAVQEKLSTCPTELKNFLDMLRLFQISAIL